MRNVFITGASGFVGTNTIKYFNEKLIFNKHKKYNIIKINEEIVLHFAGKAHDVKFYSNIDEYYKVNTEFTKKVFDCFLESDAKVFITISSVKAVADELDCELTENYIPYPATHYGKSKLLAEQYILSKKIGPEKRFYILRPTMIYGPNNKGNLNILFNFISKYSIWPFGIYQNKRSFCSIENLCFIIGELIENSDIKSGVYNITDNQTLSTNELVNLIGISLNKKVSILYIPKIFIKFIAFIGDIFKLKFNSSVLHKFSETYTVSNYKITKAINKKLPITTHEGLLKALRTF